MAEHPHNPEVAAYVAVTLDDMQIIQGLLTDNADPSCTKFEILSDEEFDVLRKLVHSTRPMIREQNKRRAEDAEEEKENQET